MSDKPRIYAFCNGGSDEWYTMSALSEDGVFLAGHCCSHPAFGPHDMGVVGEWKHETYRKYYPDGFEVVWIEDPKTNPLLQEAYAKHLSLGKEEYAERLKRIGEPEMPCVEVVVSDEATGEQHTIKRYL